MFVNKFNRRLVGDKPIIQLTSANIYSKHNESQIIDVLIYKSEHDFLYFYSALVYI